MIGGELRSVFGMRPETGRWMYVALGLAMNICLGTVYAWSVFSTPIGDYFIDQGQITVSATEKNLPFLVFLASFAILMPIAGRWFKRYDPKIVLAAGSIIVSAGWLLAGYAITILNIPLLAFSYGIIGGGGVGIVYGGPIALSTRWFPDRKGLAVGLTVLGFGVSAAITAPIAAFLISIYTLPTALMILGVAFLAILLAISLVMRFPPDGWKPAGWICPSKTACNINLSTNQMLRTPSFYALWFCFIVGAMAGLMAIGISKNVGMDPGYIGLDGVTATLAVSIFAIPNGLGRPIFGWITDRFTPRHAAILSFVLVIIGSVGMLIAGNGDLALFLLSFSCFWMTLGGWLSIAPTSTTTFFGTKNQPSNYGIVFSAYGIGAIIGNLMSGSAKDIFGGFRIVFWPTLILAIAGIVIAFFAMKAPKVDRNSQQ